MDGNEEFFVQMKHLMQETIGAAVNPLKVEITQLKGKIRDIESKNGKKKVEKVEVEKVKEKEAVQHFTYAEEALMFEYVKTSMNPVNHRDILCFLNKAKYGKLTPTEYSKFSEVKYLNELLRKHCEQENPQIRVASHGKPHIVRFVSSKSGYPCGANEMEVLIGRFKEIQKSADKYSDEKVWFRATHVVELTKTGLDAETFRACAKGQTYRGTNWSYAFDIKKEETENGAVAIVEYRVKE